MHGIGRLRHTPNTQPKFSVTMKDSTAPTLEESKEGLCRAPAVGDEDSDWEMVDKPVASRGTQTEGHELPTFGLCVPLPDQTMFAVADGIEKSFSAQSRDETPNS